MTSPRYFRSLGGQLIQRTVVLALLCMAVILAAQSWLLWQDSQQRFEQSVAEVGRTNLPLLSVGLWDIEPTAVQAQLQAIAKVPEIGFVRLRTTNGQQFQEGRTRLGEQPPTHVMNVPAPRGDWVLGQLELTGDPDYLTQAIQSAAVRILIGYGSLTMLICIMMARLLHRNLQRPLEGMARFAAELTPDQLMKPMVLDRPQRAHADEIDLVAEGFAKLQTGLRRHIEELDHLVAERTEELEGLLEETRRLSMTDALTGVWNRRTMDERLPDELERARRYGHALALMFIDVDHFKQINDMHGHDQGDAALRGVAHYVRGRLRRGVDWVARYGGEEFVVILPETTVEAARVIADRLRAEIEALTLGLPGAGGEGVRVTVSIGVTARRDDDDSQSLLKRADALVYRAKNSGRNQVVVEV